MNPFSLAFQRATPHGVLTAIHIPDSADPVPEPVLEKLHPKEADLARTLGGYRQGQFVGGRLALRRSCEQLGLSPEPLMRSARGAPVLPEGVAGSVSHKGTLAIAIASSARGATLGIDLEDYAPERPGIASHVLTEREISEIAPLPEPRRWIALALRFSLKESIYKALDPYVQRYVGFHEAEVFPDIHGAAAVSLHLKHDEGPFIVSARYAWMNGRIVTSVRIKPQPKTA